MHIIFFLPIIAAFMSVLGAPADLEERQSPRIELPEIRLGFVSIIGGPVKVNISTVWVKGEDPCNGQLLGEVRRSQVACSPPKTNVVFNEQPVFVGGPFTKPPLPCGPSFIVGGQRVFAVGCETTIPGADPLPHIINSNETLRMVCFNFREVNHICPTSNPETQKFSNAIYRCLQG